MDRKISRAARHPLIYIVIALFALAGCKQNNWIDWKTQNEIWLQANKSKPGVKCTDSGLQYKVIEDPTPQDARPNSTSTVVCDYTLKLINARYKRLIRPRCTCRI